MSNPVLGNTADELAQLDHGVDFEQINRSEISPSGEQLEVNVHADGNDIELKPVKNHTLQVVGRGFDLQHTHADLLMAQLTEEPQQSEYMVPSAGKVLASPSRLSRALSRNANREELIWYEIRPGMQCAALDLPQNATGRVIVRQDTLEGEYSCRSCRGNGYSEEVCEVCRGEQKRDGSDCRGCVVLGYDREQKWSCGHKTCDSCRGTGWRGGIIIPEVAQGKPCSGIVVSLGPNTSVAKLGDRVLYSKYAGHALTTPEGETFTTMRESEILQLIREK